MKLNKEVITHIQQAVKTANMLGIESICIDDDMVRGMREDRAVLIAHQTPDMDLPFESMGISRIPQLLNRLNIVSELDGFTIECNESANFIKSIVLKGTGTKIDFKCANPSNIVAPKKLADEPTYGINISEESIDLLKKSETAMKSDTVTFISNDVGVSFELNDVNNDVFKHDLQTEAVALQGESTSFVFKYPTKLLVSLFRNSIDYFEIAERGSLKININGFDIFVLPQV